MSEDDDLSIVLEELCDPTTSLTRLKALLKVIESINAGYPRLEEHETMHRAFTFWKEAFLHAVACDTERKLIDNYKQYWMNQNVDDTILDSAYKVVQSLMMAASHVMWYQCYKVRFNSEPGFLNGQTKTTNSLQDALRFAMGHGIDESMEQSIEISRELMQTAEREMGIDVLSQFEDSD